MAPTSALLPGLGGPSNASMRVHAPSRARGRLAVRPTLASTRVGTPTGAELEGEAPGTGHRRFPEAGQGREEGSRAAGSQFACLTTAECYAAFPLQVHASVPLQVSDREPAGVTALARAQEGPATGRRRRPSPVDPSAGASQPLPYPSKTCNLKRDLLVRNSLII